MGSCRDELPGSIKVQIPKSIAYLPTTSIIPLNLAQVELWQNRSLGTSASIQVDNMQSPQAVEEGGNLIEALVCCPTGFIKSKFNTQAEQCTCLFPVPAAQQLGFRREVVLMTRTRCHVFLLNHIKEFCSSDPPVRKADVEPCCCQTWAISMGCQCARLSVCFDLGTSAFCLSSYCLDYYCPFVKRGTMAAV